MKIVNAIRQVFHVCFYNFSSWKRNPKIFITFGLAFVLCFLLTDKAVQFSNEYSTIMQITEPFIWIFGDSDSILLASLLLIILFSDMPFLGPAIPNYLVRTTRKRWLIGQVLYVALATFVYMLFILICSILICARNSFFANVWSQTAAILGYSGAGQDLALPSTVKIMELEKPLTCMSIIFFLMLSYTLLVVFIMLYANLKLGKFWGVLSVLIFSLFGFFMKPDIFKQLFKIEDSHYFYIANVASGWVSPLNHATYYMHNFGYDELPFLWQSYVIFGGLFLVFIFLSMRAVKKYSFNFSGGGVG